MLNNDSLAYTQKFVCHYSSDSKPAAIAFVYASLSELKAKKNLFLHPNELKHYETLSFDKRRHSYLLGIHCVKNALRENIPHLSSQAILLKTGIFGQPLIETPATLKTHITVSHTEPLAATIAFPEEYPMGIDLEYIRPNIETIMQEQLTIEEKHTIQRQTIYPPATYYALYWTAKEAISKILLTGMTVPFTLYALKNLRWDVTHWLAEFEHFSQYQAISFFFFFKHICSIVYPKQSALTLDIVAIHKHFSEYLT